MIGVDKLYRSLLVIFTLSAFIVAGPVVQAQDDTSAKSGTLADAITGGQIDLGIRLRYEHVDDDAAVKDADALTNRLVLGYTTGSYRDFSARLLVQDVREIIDDFNDGTGRSASRAPFAVVADPEETDLLEGYFSYTGLANTKIKLGRQIITYRQAPFHRFVGTVLWRQNWQNHDAITLENTSLPDTTINYAYSWNINRIFTDEAVISSRANFDSNSHLVNLQYKGFKHGVLEAYAYLLDFENALAASTATYGARFSGSYPLSEQTKLLYALEYARQDDYADNPASVDEDYFLGEIGGNFRTGDTFEFVTMKFNYELLSGNGTSAFQTPIATGHAFQGWADRFLTTPADGIEDFYFTLATKVFGFGLTAVYHDLNSDYDSYDYGSELDLQAVRPLNKHFTLGIKYSNYDADTNATNLARNGSIARDVSKFWTWLEFKY